MRPRRVAVPLVLPLFAVFGGCQDARPGEAPSSVSAAVDFDRGSDADECKKDDFLPTEPGEPIHRQRPDRELRRMLREIDHNQIESTIEKLASFGTRHTLSSQTDPVRGIGAATKWIFDTLSAYAAASGGRMTVEQQTFMQAPGPRIPQPTPITNVIATLRGSDSPGRMYVVSGHID